MSSTEKPEIALAFLSICWLLSSLFDRAGRTTSHSHGTHREPPYLPRPCTSAFRGVPARLEAFVLSSALLSKRAGPVRVGGETPARGRHRETGGQIMARLVVTEFVSLDGVMDDPGGSEGTKHGAWTFQF